MIFQAADLADASGSTLELTKSGLAAFTQPPEVVIRDMWNRWLTHTQFDEFARINIVRGQQLHYQSFSLTEAASRRNMVELALNECTVGKWVSFNDLSTHIRAIGVKIESAYDPQLLRISGVVDGFLGQDEHFNWKILEEPYLLCLLFEYAATLGLIDLAYTNLDGARNAHHKFPGGDSLKFFCRYDGLQFIRLTPLGEYCLGRTDSYQLPEPRVKTPTRLLPDLRLVTAESEFVHYEKVFIECFAEPESDSLWRLDLIKSVDTLKNGYFTAENLRTFLAERDDQPMPERIEGFLRNIEIRSQAAERLGETVLYEFKDTEVAQHISTDKRTKEYCSFVYENVLGVCPASEKKFQDEVRKMGYGIQRK